MDYKEEYFKIIEALSDTKVALEDALNCVKKIQHEAFLRFDENNASKEDARRIGYVLFTEGRR